MGCCAMQLPRGQLLCKSGSVSRCQPEHGLEVLRTEDTNRPIDSFFRFSSFASLSTLGS